MVEEDQEEESGDGIKVSNRKGVGLLSMVTHHGMIFINSHSCGYTKESVGLDNITQILFFRSAALATNKAHMVASSTDQRQEQR